MEHAINAEWLHNPTVTHLTVQNMVFLMAHAKQHLELKAKQLVCDFLILVGQPIKVAIIVKE